jgi:hypothetical protein
MEAVAIEPSGIERLGLPAKLNQGKTEKHRL